MDLSGKVALVTGAGNGIGRAIALGLSAAGATTIVCDIDAAAGERTAKSIVEQGRVAVAMPLDVSDPAEVAAVYAEVAQRYGRLDIQISNAGITTRAPFLEVDLETFHRIMSVNLYGTFLCGQAAGRLMRPTGGRIVNLTSVSGQQGGTGRAAYGASKAAIINLTQTMALELAEHGILVGTTTVEGDTSSGRMVVPAAASSGCFATAATSDRLDALGCASGDPVTVAGTLNGTSARALTAPEFNPISSNLTR